MTAAAVEPWAIREATDDDMAFVWETTLKVRKPHGFPWTDWKALHGDETHDMLRAARVLVLDGGGVLMGFVVAAASPDGPVLEMVYVKRGLRGNGFGATLLEAVGFTKTVPVTRSNPCWRRWAQHHGIRWEAT